MTLVASIGSVILAAMPEAVGGAAASAAGALTGATGLAVSAPEVAGAVGLGTGVGGLAAANKIQQNALNKVPANSGPQLAPGLSPAMSAPQALAPATAAPMAGLASIGQNKPTGMAHGGQVPVKNGAFIIPADVVSALGNGSSKAGAAFLDRLMEEVKAQGAKRHGLGAVHDRA